MGVLRHFYRRALNESITFRVTPGEEDYLHLWYPPNNWLGFKEDLGLKTAFWLSRSFQIRAAHEQEPSQNSQVLDEILQLVGVVPEVMHVDIDDQREGRQNCSA